jgi:hypothetical protein
MQLYTLVTCTGDDAHPSLMSNVFRAAVTIAQKSREQERSNSVNVNHLEAELREKNHRIKDLETEVAGYRKEQGEAEMRKTREGFEAVMQPDISLRAATMKAQQETAQMFLEKSRAETALEESKDSHKITKMALDMKLAEELKSTKSEETKLALRSSTKRPRDDSS